MKVHQFGRIGFVFVLICFMTVQVLWAGGLLERDANRLKQARENHASEIERAFDTYQNRVERANNTLERIYDQIITRYEGRGERDTAEQLRQELARLQQSALTLPFPDDVELPDKNNDDLPENAHAQLIRAIGPSLVNAVGQRAPTQSLAEYRYVVLYYTAGWCGPCQRFTPQLLDFYRENRDMGTWEVVVVSGDRSESDFYDYLRDAGMPWAAIPYDRIEASNLNQAFPGGYPRVVVLDHEGNAVHRASGVPSNPDQFFGHLRTALQP